MLTLMVFLTYELTTAFEFSQMNKTESAPNQTNARNVSTACNLEIKKSSLKKIFELIHQKKANAIALNVWIESLNNTSKKTRLTPTINLANEKGRTLITLILQADFHNCSTVLSSCTTTLIAGVDNVDLVVFERTKACLLWSENNLFDIVVNLLIRELYHDDKKREGSDYQLCVKHIVTLSDNYKDAKYNCCSQLGGKNMLMCSDYSSILLEFYTTYLMIGLFSFFIYVFLALTLEYIDFVPNECKQYKISDSPMSLLSVFNFIFIQGHGPVKSFGRRLVIAAIIVSITLPRHWNLGTYVVVCLWGLLFAFFNVYHFKKEHNLSMLNARSGINRSPIIVLFFRQLQFRSSAKFIALPFNLKFWWNKVKKTEFFRKYFKLNLDNAASNATRYQHVGTIHGVTERTNLLPNRNEPRQVIIHPIMNICKYCLSVVILLTLYLTVVLPLSFLCSGLYLFWLRFGIIPSFNTREASLVTWKRGFMLFCLTLFDVFTLVILYLFFANFFNLVFYLVSGLYLNGGFFSVYFVPVSTIVLYWWTNWRFLVEAKYLELNTKIYKVSKEGITQSVHVTRPEGSLGETSQSSTETDTIRRFKIKLDENGEPLIPKPLYDIVREKFLPYDEILVPFFGGLTFVVIFAYFLYIFMSLAQASGISSSVQIISAMAATSLPFLVNVFWKKYNDEQKKANNLALKYKLKHVLFAVQMKLAEKL